MSASGGSKAIIAAFLANLGIALAKFVAWALSGSASMLAEAIHSVADSGNQLLLMRGGRRARREADQEHPFGYGRERYVSAFVVSIILFSLGGLFAVYEGVQKLIDPHEIDSTWWWLPLAVLVIAIGLESFSLRTAVRESNRVREKDQSWFSFVRRSKAPELPVVLLEDVGALIGLTFALFGVGLTLITGNTMFDALGTLMIGLLLILIAIVLGLETKSLLIGEGATPTDHDLIVEAITGGREVQKLIHIKTLYLGPDELMVAAKIALTADKTVREAAADIDEIESRIREAVPAARVVYLEPDVYRPSLDPEPPTDAFVLRSSD
ncbi:cation diffusion facilitator family transporter [Microbacterium esteraromaticum]|uniref:Cation diffusion facilitator family transporter n=1 Tax=Microbacterium esteraromaticum TaxID=57043 RepID=A0A939DU49_9MICO|nr:cation diffusion facilitator family transporter [Microbacterium esteraromaticum]MBN7793497.1 cation diffusion facilitator family transporter [Microbacterium esteraromaticum]MBN8205241.1 cation diffusion facilitator family transporter [Microbacterium esteraromaticum]MBN8415395.1 cation diffusion facilitator family transporter [Microbacterium esteraromaticum]MBN8424256.1 cation diffusion facilitator family transporter [Microbacterium esteraromaticum]MBY6060188.1 cation diffusion facilitator f